MLLAASARRMIQHGERERERERERKREREKEREGKRESFLRKGSGGTVAEKCVKSQCT